MARIRTSLKRLKENGNTNSTSRLKSLALGLGVITGIAVGIGLYELRMNNRTDCTVKPDGIERKVGKISLEDARRDKSLRQAYINQIIGTNVIPYCDGVVYDAGNTLLEYNKLQMIRKGFSLEKSKMTFGSENQRFSGNNYYMCTPGEVSWIGKGEKLKIFVGKQLFEDDYYKEFGDLDILETILNHEAIHVKRHAEGLPYFPNNELLKGLKNGKIKSRNLNGIGELDVRAHELSNLLKGKFMVNTNNLEYVKRQFVYQTHALIDAQGRGRLSPEENLLAEKLLEYIFQMPEVRDISLDSTNNMLPKDLYKFGLGR